MQTNPYFCLRIKLYVIKIVLKNMLNNKTILSKRYNQTIINAYLLESEWFNEKFSVEDIQTVFNWKNFNKRY